LVKADETMEPFSVYTDKAEYLVGEVINIYVKANEINPNETITVTEVVVYDPSNTSVAEWHDLSIMLTDTATPIFVGKIISKSEGSYTVLAEAAIGPLLGSGGGQIEANCGWWIWRVIWRFICRFWRNHHVIPEVPIGTIVTVIGLMGATGLYVVQKRNPKKTEQ
jgi:hypothetical protein